MDVIGRFMVVAASFAYGWWLWKMIYAYFREKSATYRNPGDVREDFYAAIVLAITGVAITGMATLGLYALATWVLTGHGIGH